MLIATSAWRHEALAVETVVVLGTSLRGHVVRRTGLVVDSRFLVGGALDPPRGVATLYLVPRGWLAPQGGARVEGPSAWVLDEHEFETITPESPAFATGGSPFVALQLCVSKADLAVQGGLAQGPRALPASVWRAVEELVACTEEASVEARFVAVLGALVEAGIVAARVLDEAGIEEPAHLRRVWSVIATLYREQNTSAYVKALAAAAQLSIRQTERDLADLSRRMGVADGFRATVKLLRLRRAVMLLSAHDATVTSVARIVGYGSADAMGRAFRDAGLPTPGAVRASLARLGAGSEPPDPGGAGRSSLAT